MTRTQEQFAAANRLGCDSCVFYVDYICIDEREDGCHFTSKETKPKTEKQLNDRIKELEEFVEHFADFEGRLGTFNEGDYEWAAKLLENGNE